MVRPLEEIDPLLINQAVIKVCKTPRPPDKEVCIAQRLSESPELAEWVELIAAHPFGDLAKSASLYAAIAIGLEVGYVLGEREALREVLIPIKEAKVSANP